MKNNARSIFVDNLKHFATVNNKDQLTIAKDLKLPTTTVNNWFVGKSYPRVDKMQMLADYFHVSMRDLTDKESPALTLKDSLEIELINKYRRTSNKNKTIILALLDINEEEHN